MINISKKFSIKHICLLSYLLMVGLVVCAQNTVVTVPYTCSFEQSEATEINNWVVNAGADGVNCNDQWMIGGLEHNDGKQSLYISCDAGKTAMYGSKKNLVVAYRVFEFSETVSVDITFDYKLYGSENTSMLYVGLIPERLDISSNSTNPSLSSTIKNQLPHRFSQSINWTTYTLQNPVSSSSSTFSMFAEEPFKRKFSGFNVLVLIALFASNEMQ